MAAPGWGLCALGLRLGPRLALGLWLGLGLRLGLGLALRFWTIASRWRR